MRIFRFATLLALALALALPVTFEPPAAVAQEAEEVDELYTAFAVSMGNVATGRRGRVEFFVTGWTSDEERNVFAQALVDDANDGLRRAFDNAREVGRVRVGNRMSYPLFYSREILLDTGVRRLVLATNRPIPFIEAWANTRTRDFDITMIVMDLDADGSGSGQAALGVEFEVNPENNVLQIKNFGTEPVRLTNISRRR